MVRSKKLALAVVVGSFAMAVSSTVFAQTKDMPKTTDGYGYTFEDDPLNAGGFGPNDATIRVRPRAARTTLIRPRTSFVPEMLKSGENL
jgi:hypothetical protein